MRNLAVIKIEIQVQSLSDRNYYRVVINSVERSEGRARREPVFDSRDEAIFFALGLRDELLIENEKVELTLSPCDWMEEFFGEGKRWAGHGAMLVEDIHKPIVIR